ncbi:tetratricopeptide repeat-containing sensor histidine kinase [Sphingobacterium corticis]|uniref:tetratricopeptide repeat-containing sensor histidine kinase n=1 Tax=Sphingobacterium corticis TaxID=1812823 RepID=UPI0036D30F1E
MTSNAFQRDETEIKKDSVIRFSEKLKSLYQSSDFAGVLSLQEEFGYIKRHFGAGKGYFPDLEMIIAKSLYNLGDYEKSLTLVLRELTKYEDQKDLKGIADARNILGLIYLEQHQYEAALQEFSKSANQHKKLRNFRRLSANLLNMGLVHKRLHHPDSAQYYYLLSKQYASNSAYSSVVAMANNRLGELYASQMKLKEAVRSYNSVLNDTTFTDDWELSFAHSGIASCYAHLGHYEKARKHALTGYELANKLKTKWDIKRAAEVLSEVSVESGDFKDAFFYQSVAIKYRDSILSESKRISLDSMQMSFQRLANEKLKIENDSVLSKLRIGQLMLILACCIIGFVAAIWLTARKHNRTTMALNRELRINSQLMTQRNKLIEKQNDELKEVVTTKDFLIAVLTHDLRTPMTSILSVIKYIEETDLNIKEMKEWLGMLHNQTLSTSKLMDNLLLWSEIQRSGVKVKRECIQTSNMVSSIITMLQKSIHDKNLNFVHVPEPDVTAFVDPYHLQIILSNIISNAIKFTPKGGDILVNYEHREDKLLINIRDTGMGMNAEKLKQIQANNTSLYFTHGTDQERGFGMGMKLIYHFLKANGGELLIESKEGVGSLFSIVLTISE